MLVSKTFYKSLDQLARLQVSQHGLLEFEHATEYRRASLGNFLLLTRFGHAMNRQSQTSSKRGGDETGCNNHQRVSAHEALCKIKPSGVPCVYWLAGKMKTDILSKLRHACVAVVALMGDGLERDGVKIAPDAAKKRSEERRVGEG